MRLLSGASLSVVNSGTCAAMRLNASIEVLGSTDEIMMASVPAATRSSIKRILQRGGALRRIFELQFVVGQFALRLLHAGFRQLPEIRSGIDHESQLLLVLGLNSRCQSKRYGR